MTPYAAIKAMARRAAKALVLAGLLSTPALAGDRALIDFIGYSESGRYFAFTEMGVQDGSGFPYANVFVLDVSSDSFVAGSPFRVRLDSEEQSVAEAQRQALAAAQPTLDRLDIGFPVDIWVLAGDGVEGVTTSMEFGLPGFMAVKSVRDAQSVVLESFAMPDAQPCASYTDDPILGIELTHTDQNGSRVVHRDETIPASRGCPLAYSLFAVVSPMQADTISGAVAIISVFSVGFEGPDRRFIAIPIGR